MKEDSVMSINNSLKEVYVSKWDNLTQRLKDESEYAPTHPLLISLPDEDEYLKSDLRVMFVGKETNDWEGAFGTRNIDQLLKTYRAFLNKQGSRKSPFWQYIRKWQQAIEEEYPNKKVSLVWNNILKIGKAKEIGEPNEQILQINKESFDVFHEELKILKPHIVVFWTGHSYDKHLKRYIPNIEFKLHKSFKKKQWLNCSSTYLPALSFRTYHPGYLNRLQDRSLSFHSHSPLNELLVQIAELESSL